MYYQKQGEGVAVVFLHGFCETLAIWDQIVSELRNTFQVITLDLPGFGKSSHLEAPSALDQVAEQVHDFLQLLGIKEYIIVGHSLGGYISLELAKSYPESILGIGMINSTAFADSQEKINTRKKTMDFVEKRGTELFVKSFIPQLFSDKNARDIVTVINLAKHTLKHSLINYTKAMMKRESYVFTLKSWVKPLIFIAGEKDTLVPIDRSRAHLQFISKDNYFELRKAGHMGIYESPNEVVKLLAKFV